MKKMIATAMLFASAVVQADAGGRAELIRDFVAGYNSGDVAGMLALCTDDVQWLAVSNGQVSVITEGSEALGDALEQFFLGESSPKSELLEVTVAGPKVITVEQAFWQSESGEQSQCSIAVYEIHDQKISRVWYFDAYDC